MNGIFICYSYLHLIFWMPILRTPFCIFYLCPEKSQSKILKFLFSARRWSHCFLRASSPTLLCCLVPTATSASIQVNVNNHIRSYKLLRILILHRTILLNQLKDYFTSLWQIFLEYIGWGKIHELLLLFYFVSLHTQFSLWLSEISTGIEAVFS